MASPIIHRCHHCGYESEISGSLSEFAEDPFCKQCGLSASESDTKLQEELSRLIDQQLNLNQSSQQHLVSTPITYITQHYHHSGHLVSTPNNRDDSTYQLTSHGIDVSVLSPAQIRLFSNALPEQQARLIELWQIAPPKLSDRNVGNWPQTSFEQEEDLARTRYLQMVTPITIPSEKSAVQQIQTGITIEAESPTESRHPNAEPYMVNGYASTSPEDNGYPFRSEDNRIVDYNRARDPVYQHQNLNKKQDQSSREWWKHGSGTDEMGYQQSLEHQYGAFQMRNFYGSEQVGHQQEDEEML